jgi:hypothetical protein
VLVQGLSPKRRARLEASTLRSACPYPIPLRSPLGALLVFQLSACGCTSMQECGRGEVRGRALSPRALPCMCPFLFLQSKVSCLMNMWLHFRVGVSNPCTYTHIKPSSAFSQPFAAGKLSKSWPTRCLQTSRTPLPPSPLARLRPRQLSSPQISSSAPSRRDPPQVQCAWLPLAAGPSPWDVVQRNQLSAVPQTS